MGSENRVCCADLVLSWCYGLGIQHNSLVIGLYSIDAVLCWIRHVDLIEDVLTASRLTNELCEAGTLHDDTVWQLIEVAGEHDS